MHCLKKCILFFFLIGITVPNVCSATVPPSIRSTEVSANGSVITYWIPSADTGSSFYAYVLYRSTSAAGPFTVVDSVFNYNQFFYTDASANGNSFKYFYFLTTLSDCCVLTSEPSDTLATLKLNVVNSGNGVAYLTWNELHIPNLASSSTWHTIYNQYPSSGWRLIDSTQQTNFLDTTTACNQQVNYRVELRDDAGFTSVSNISGDIFRDLVPPALTYIDSVSVDPFNGSVSIGWQPNLTKDTKGYIIYRFNGISWDSISTVYGYMNTGYVYNGASATTGVEQYTIATLDSCNNSTGFSEDHSTIFLTSAANKCGRGIDLNWTSYLNMTGGVDYYEVFAQKNGGIYESAGTVSGNVYTFSFTAIEADSVYCFYVRAVGNNTLLSSSSNSSCVVATAFKIPAFTYIRSATVVSANSVNVFCYLDSTADVVQCNLLRSEDSTGAFVLITSLNYDQSVFFTLNDPDAATSDRSYFYKFETIDSCGNVLSESNIAKTILSKSIAESNFINLVTWDDYQGWPDGISHFNIYRKLSSSASSLYLATVTSDTYFYRDDVIEKYTEQGQFCYSIEAVEKGANPYGFRDSSFSNEVCNWQIPLSFIPNAFIPFGHNPVFYPINVFVDMRNYSFRVFNRWGEIIYETSNPADGWDGTSRGKQMSFGMYVYYLEYLDQNGNEIKRRGTITLLR